MHFAEFMKIMYNLIKSQLAEYIKVLFLSALELHAVAGLEWEIRHLYKFIFKEFAKICAKLWQYINVFWLSLLIILQQFMQLEELRSC